MGGHKGHKGVQYTLDCAIGEKLYWVNSSIHCIVSIISTVKQWLLSFTFETAHCATH